MKAFRFGSLLLLMMLAAGSLAADSSPLGDFKTLPAKTAADTYASTLARLTREFKEKGDGARKTCISQLTAAQQAATKAGNLDEAVHIRDVIATLNAQVAENATTHAAGGLIAERLKLTQALDNTVWQSGDTKLKFNDDGTGSSDADGGKPGWDWVAINGRKAYVRYPSGATNRLEFDDSLKTFIVIEFGAGRKVDAQGGKRVGG